MDHFWVSGTSIICHQNWSKVTVGNRRPAPLRVKPFRLAPSFWAWIGKEKRGLLSSRNKNFAIRILYWFEASIGVVSNPVIAQRAIQFRRNNDGVRIPKNLRLLFWRIRDTFSKRETTNFMRAKKLRLNAELTARCWQKIRFWQRTIYRGTLKEIQLKYARNKPSPPRRAGRLGEIVNPAAISTYFTERSDVYFYCISF